MSKSRTKGSVKNVRRAIAAGDVGRAAVRGKVNTMSRGTEGSKLKAANRQRGLRGPGNQ